MRHPLLFKLALLAGGVTMIAAATPAEAQRYGGGFHGAAGGFRGGGFGGHGFYGRSVAGVGRWHGGGWRGGGWYGGGWRGGAWRGAAWGVPGRGYYRAYGPGRYWGGYGYRRYGYWPYAAPFVGGLVLGGLAATYPYTYGYYDYPYSYPYVIQNYPTSVYGGAYAVGPIGAYCQTPVRTCQLIDVAEVGGGCSCSVAGGRVRGAVVP